MFNNPLKLILASGLWLIPSLTLQAAIASTIPIPSSDRNSLLSSNFGRHGYNGRNGRNGRDGRNGTDKTVTASGSAFELDLAGTDGEDGEPGSYGSDAVCYGLHGKYKSDIKLPNGGRGGNGGNGGNGGDGGSLTVFYDRLENLKQIYVVSLGGYGGRGGAEGGGGRGCYCPSWGFKNHKSDRHEKKYYCYSGKDGRWGRVGRDGIDGRLGKLYLVKGKDKLPVEQLQDSISLSAIARGKTIVLTNNLWKSNRGANSLLAANSIIDDTYEEYIDTLIRNISFAWNESRSVRDFTDESLELQLTEENKLKITYPEAVWLDTTLQTTQENTLLTINHAIAEAEATRLERGLISGNRSDLVFSAIDLAQKSDIIQTQFKIKYRTNGDRFSTRRDSRNYKTRYEGIIPTGAITRNNQRFALNLGQLPIDNKYLQSGVAIEIELTVIRSLGDNSAEQKIYWQGEIE